MHIRQPRSIIAGFGSGAGVPPVPLSGAEVRRAFTLIEVLVVIGVTALLLAILLPVLASAGDSARIAHSGSNLRQLGAATHTYLTNYNNHLPQYAWDVGGGNMAIIAALFGGKKGELPFFGINEVGADRRPLNRYLGPRMDEDEEMPVFESPLDIGQPDTGFGATDSLYDYLGSSYTMNDHALDGEQFSTLIPAVGPDGRPGGRMPPVEDTTRTWVIAEHPIYNYQQDGDRRQRWYDGEVRASMWFLDGHTALAVEIPPGVTNTTKDYTFLPSRDWIFP